MDLFIDFNSFASEVLKKMTAINVVIIIATDVLCRENTKGLLTCDTPILSTTPVIPKHIEVNMAYIIPGLMLTCF